MTVEDWALTMDAAARREKTEVRILIESVELCRRIKVEGFYRGC
jgi:hypothetical protein